MEILSIISIIWSGILYFNPSYRRVFLEILWGRINQLIRKELGISLSISPAYRTLRTVSSRALSNLPIFYTPLFHQKVQGSFSVQIYNLYSSLFIILYYMLVSPSNIFRLVVSTLWNIWVRQLGWWNCQYDGTNKSHVPNHQPDCY